MPVRVPKIPPRSTLLSSSLDGMDDLFDFRTKEEKADAVPKTVDGGLMELEFDCMESFPDHKFRLYTGQRLKDMVDSIREYGILEPLVLWRHDGRYTILSGHNRVNAAKIAGLTKGPVVIRENLTDEEAVLIVTETNLRQRSFDDLSHSEKAYCLKQHYDAIKSQGRRSDLIKEIEELVNPHETGENGTLVENPKKSDAGSTVGEEYGLSRDRVSRYIRIATLIEPLLTCMDEKKLGFEAAYDLSFMKADMQAVIAELICVQGMHVDTRKAALLHKYAKSGTLNEGRIRQIIAGEKAGVPKNSDRKPIRIGKTVIQRFFRREQSQKEIEDTIIKALEQYFAKESGDMGNMIG